MKTLKDLQLDFIAARQETKRLFKVHVSERTIQSFENWKMAKAKRNELNALIQSW